MVSKIEVINEILAKIGDHRINNLEADDADTQDFAILFDGGYREIMALKNWNFTYKITKLTPLAEKAIEGYEYTYAVPSDRLGELQLPRGYNIDSGYSSYDGKEPVKLEGERIYSNIKDLTIEYQGFVEFENAPGYFQELAKLKFLKAVMQRNAGQVPPSVQRDYDIAYQYALNQNRQTAGGVNITNNRLVGVHLGGGVGTSRYIRGFGNG